MPTYQNASIPNIGRIRERNFQYDIGGTIWERLKIVQMKFFCVSGTSFTKIAQNYLTEILGSDRRKCDIDYPPPSVFLGEGCLSSRSSNS
jgi:hypothetical protein